MKLSAKLVMGKLCPRDSVRQIKSVNKSLTKKLLCFLGGALVLSTGVGQKIQPLTIGDTLPDIALNNIINYKTTSARLSDFRDKPIIIDFFATWCTSCIAALPHLDSLQKRFGGCVQVFVVTYEPEQKLRSFLVSNKTAETIHLPFVTEDIMLSRLFPYKTIPHEVIIDKGIVKGITYAEYINAPVIQQLLSAGQINVPLKKDVLYFDRQKTFLQNSNVDFGGKTIFQFLLAGNIDGLGGQSGVIYSADSSSKRLFFTNRPLLYYFFRAVGMDSNFNRLILEVKDTAKYIRDREVWVEWAKKNYYSLEMIVPGSTSSEQINEWMLQELNLCLHTHARVETRNIHCMVLKAIEKAQQKVTQDMSNNDLKTEKHVFRYNTILDFITGLNSQSVGRPLHPVVLDETAITSPVNLSIPVGNIQDLPAVNKALIKYRLALEPALRPVPVLVVTEDGYIPSPIKQ